MYGFKTEKLVGYTLKKEKNPKTKKSAVRGLFSGKIERTPEKRSLLVFSDLLVKLSCLSGYHKVKSPTASKRKQANNYQKKKKKEINIVQLRKMS
jgi:hypothetical protein